jgi:antitoxin HicB
MRYRVTLTPAEGGGFLSELPDFLGVFSYGKDKREALTMVLDAALTVCAQRILDKESIPVPPRTVRAGDSIDLPPMVVAKVAIHNAMVEQSVTQVALAERLKTDPKAIRRLLDLDHKSKWGQLEEALQVMGYVIHASVERSPSLPTFRAA